MEIGSKARGIDDLFKVRALNQELEKSVPSAWVNHLQILAVHDYRTPVWLMASAWLERVEQFKEQHGGALSWSMTDHDICEKARALALWVQELLDLKTVADSDTPALSMGGRDCSDAEKLDKVMAICDVVGVDYPAALTGTGAVNRALSATWWRRVIRRKVARTVEHGAIKLGVVNRKDGGYCSHDAVERRGAQIRRNAEMMAGTLFRNEAGQVFTLATLATASTANPEIRGGELMTRIRGCEEMADTLGHVGYFLTGTCPSRFHAVQSGGKGKHARQRKNPKYDGVSTPRDAQMWLRTMWARTRAECAREGVGMYGFRVAEPHHDGCPHWHLLLWFRSQLEADQALSIFGKHWLSDREPVALVGRRGFLRNHKKLVTTHEAGALKNRVDVKKMVQGGAAGYIAKYVAKNIGHFDVGVHLDGMEVDTRDVKGWQRVDAWAATWGIRQFQGIGQPSVTVWRELRRVTPDQIEAARVGGDSVAWRAWGSVHKHGGLSSYVGRKSGNGVDEIAKGDVVQACWMRFMKAMGGVCIKRKDYAIQPAMRVNADHVNGYGEAVGQKKIVGLVLNSGRWLISRRQAWARVVDEVVSDVEDLAALAAPWTGFNNCTARLGGSLRAALLGLRGGSNGSSVDVVGAYGAGA